MINFWEKLPKPIIALAPMCGITNLPFRQICHEQGADAVYTEMIMVQALSRKGAKTLKLAEVSKKEKPVIIQLGGNEPELFFKSAKIAADLGADGIDINFGCPAKKIAGNGSGVALLRDLEKSYQIIQATIEGAGSLPVSIKTRSQIKTKDKAKTVTSLDLLEKIKDLPVAAVMIHGRSFEAPWIENVDYDYIKKVREYFKGILLANGGIYNPETAKKVLALTGADGLGIGHGVYGRPWIFKQIKEYLKKGKYSEPNWKEKKNIIVEHAKLAYKHGGDHGIIEMRKHLLWYAKGFEHASEIRQQLVKVKTLKEIEEIFSKI